MWGKMRDIFNRYTVLSVFLLVLFFTIMTTIVGLPTMQGSMDLESGMLTMTLYQVLLALMCIFLMYKLDVVGSNDFTFKNTGKGLLLGWILYLLMGISVFTGYQNRSDFFVTPDPLLLLVVIIFPFSTAFLEETLFRGLILKILLKNMATTKKTVYYSFIISALLFGIVHFIHIIWADPLQVIADLVLATAGGVLLGAIYLRSKTLIAPILLHGLFNLAGGIFVAFTNTDYTVPQATFSDVITMLVVALPLILAALILLRKVNPEEISFNNSVVTDQ